jgi:hypothetical protein
VVVGFDPESGQNLWRDTSTGVHRYGGETPPATQAPLFGSPWQGDRTGWTPENIDAIFNAYAKSEAGNVGAQTLAKLREYNVDPNVSLDALWRSATESANPNWAGGSPTGISRGIWEKAGILPMVDTPQLRAQQGQEDHNIWAGQQQSDDGLFGGGLGDLLKIASLVGGGLGLAGLAGLGPFASAGGLSAGAGLTEAGWGFGAGGLGLDAGLTGAATAGGTLGGGMDWWNTDWGTEGLVNNGIETMPFTTDPRFAGTTVDFTTSKVGGLNMNDYYSMLDDIQAGTNGVTAPSPTMSIPGYGDIYGPMGNILKNVNNIPGLSQLLRGASSGNTSALDAIKKIFSGNGSWSDGLSALGGIAPSLLGMYASNQQTNALKDLANKYSEYGAPYRSQLAEISADPNKFYNSTAAQKGVDTVLNKLSIGGNPSGSPYKQQLAVDSLWNDYGKERDRLAGFGGLTNYNAAAPSLDAQAVNSQGNMYNALGAGLNDIFNPKTSLADLLKQGKVV